MADVRVAKLATTLLISDEQLRDAQEMGAAFQRYMDATPEQRIQWAREAEAKRREVRQAAGEPVELTLDRLLDKLGFSREYAEHLVQPYCYCSDGADGWDRCEHARDDEASNG